MHGSAWEFLRNEKFDANNFFSNAARTPRQAFKQNQFGFTLGGPVLIPKIYNGHNQTFFFVGLRGAAAGYDRLFQPARYSPDAFRTGDFSSYRPRIYDPRTRALGPNGVVTATPFANNQIPPRF